MRKYLLAILLGILAMPVVRATVAYPWPQEVALPDGSTITIQMYGDEFGGFATTSDGYRVTREADGFYYYETATYTTKSGVSTGLRANNPGRRTAAERGRLSDVLRELTTAEMTAGEQLRQQSAALFEKKTIQTKAGRKIHPEKLLVIMVEFADTKFTAPNAKAAIADVFNKRGYMGYGSVKDFFVENSGGAYNPTFDVVGVATMDNKSEFYAKNEMVNMLDLVVSACKAVSGSVNYADYDCNGDGVVDNVYIVFAGHNQAEGGGNSTIWPHASDIRGANKNLVLNGKQIGPYSCGSEYRLASGSVLSGIGTYCHEFGHILGLMDMYDTDKGAGGGESPGLFRLSLMSSGNYNNNSYTPPSLNAFERSELGWLALPELTPGKATLQAINLNKGYRISTSQANEYFVLEVRDNTGWDKYISANSAAPFQGLVIYQVDQTDRVVNGISARSRWQINQVNTFPDHMCMRLRPASNLVNAYEGAPYPGGNGNNVFSRLSLPAAVDWDGVPLGVEITDIEYNSSKSTFTVRASQTYRKVSGSIMDQNSQPLANVMVRLVPTEATKSAAAGVALLRLGNETKANNTYLVATDGAGRYNFATIPEGSYTLTASLYGYQPYAKAVTVGGGDLVVPKLMMPTSVIALASLVSHYSGLPLGYITVDSQVDGLRMLWTAEMVGRQAMVGDVVNNIYWNTAYENQLCTASIRVNNYSVESFEFISQAGVNIIPVPHPVTVESGKSLAIEIITPRVGGNIVLADVGPGVASHGDLLRRNDEWVSASGVLGVSLNIALGYVKEKNPPILQKAKLRIAATGQRDVTLAWGSTDVNVDKWLVVVKNIKADEVRTIEFDSPRAIFVQKLQPATLYSASVYSIYEGKQSEPEVVEFSTQPLTAPYVAMTISVTDPVVGQRVSLGITNAPKNVTSVEWEVNSVLLATSSVVTVITPDNVSELIVMAKVSYEDGTREVILRKLKVRR